MPDARNVVVPVVVLTVVKSVLYSFSRSLLVDQDLTYLDAVVIVVTVRVPMPRYDVHTDISPDEPE